MTSDIGRKIHAQAEHARESGQFLEALQYCDQATLAYQKDQDYLGLAEVQASKQSTFKHLYEQTGDEYFLILQKHAAQASVEIAEKSGIKEALAIPYHNLGKYYEEMEDFANACKYFEISLNHMMEYPQTQHNRPAVVLDIKTHLYSSKYRAGDKEALPDMEQATRDLETVEEMSDYNKKVWLSGAYIRLFKMLNADDPESAKRYLQKAKEVIELDPRLTLRKEQLDRLSKKI